MLCVCVCVLCVRVCVCLNTCANIHACVRVCVNYFVMHRTSQECIHSPLHSGMLSKSRGQVLRLAAVFNILFTLDNDHPTDDVSDKAVKAAINFVKVTC